MRDPKWYRCHLAYSAELYQQVYRFTCRSCGRDMDRPGDDGFNPPAGCVHCGATDGTFKIKR